ncbi:MAG: preprotein translocase subunit YajC [Clostridiales Family XIII bacterium]|jgi:preprotein translocase subunit YajC|nr:preprotein translocase subunit YajC [Clostridiales Family XIII bacterium]
MYDVLIATASTLMAATQPMTDCAPTSKPSIAMWIAVSAVIIVILFSYFRMKRNQKKFNKLLDNLRPGDEIVTAGGVVATIFQVEDEEALVTVAQDIRVRILLRSIAMVKKKDNKYSVNP